MATRRPCPSELDGPPLTIEAEGMAQSDVKPRFVGRLTASAPSLRQAFAMFGLSPPLPGPFDNFKLAATARLEPDSIQLSQLRFSADNNAFEGAADFRREDERLNFQAKLSSGNFSLKPMLAYLPSLSNGDGQWSRETFDLPDLSRADVDLRLSAAHARLARLSVDDAEFSLGLRAGRLEIALDQAKAYKGSLKARATFAPGAQDAVDPRGRHPRKRSNHRRRRGRPALGRHRARGHRRVARFQRDAGLQRRQHGRPDARA